jgi:antitoxin component YwqK of YwqJK toxin-antitoxin module
MKYMNINKEYYPFGIMSRRILNKNDTAYVIGYRINGIVESKSLYTKNTQKDFLNRKDFYKCIYFYDNGSIEREICYKDGVKIADIYFYRNTALGWKNEAVKIDANGIPYDIYENMQNMCLFKK